MKKILLIFSLILGIFCGPIFAQDEIVIIDSVATEGVYAGEVFPVGIAIYNALPNTTFYYKIYGGIGENVYYIQNNSSLSYDTNWSLFPTFTTDPNGNAYIETTAYIKPDSPEGYYDFYVQLAFPDYSVPDNYISIPQPIRVISPFVTPTPSLIPTVTSIIRPSSTSTPPPIPSRITQTIPTLSPSPTIDPKKFGLINSTPIISSTPTPNVISNLTDPNLLTIQTGSNPTKPSEPPQTQKTKTISNLGIKVFFIYLLISISFILYLLCFYGYTFETLLLGINQFILKIKPQFRKILSNIKKIFQTIFKSLHSLYLSIKAYIKNTKAIDKFLNNFSKTFFLLYKTIINIINKFIKYNSYFFNQIFIFIKKHIKIPRKIKRYLSHRKLKSSILIIFGLFFSIYIKIALATDFYSTGESLLNNTVSISGTTGDLQLDDTNYRILRSFPTSYTADYQTTMIDAAASVGSTAYTDRAVLTWNVPATGDYLVLASAGVGRSSTTAARTTKVQMTINGTSYAETFSADDVIKSENYRYFSGARIQSLTAGSNTIKIQYAATNTTTNRGLINNARITAMKVNNHQYTNPANGTTTSATYADIATLTITPKITEDWLIIGHADMTNNRVGTTLSYANLMVGNTQLAESVIRVANASHFLPFDVNKSMTLNANTSYTFKLQMKRNSGTLTYKNVGIYAIPKSIFSHTASVESLGETTCSTCTQASPTTIGTLSFTPPSPGDYWISLTGAQGVVSDAAIYSGVNLKIGSTIISTSIVDVGTTFHYSSFYMDKVVNLSTGISIMAELFSQTSGTDVKAKDIRINAIKLGAANGQKMEVEYTGIGDTLNWSRLYYLVNSGFSIASVGTSIQLWDYNSSAYSTSGDGFLSYISSATPNTFEEKTQSITTNPTYFRNSSTGEWKLKMKCTTSDGNWIDWSGDLLQYTPSVAIASTTPIVPILISPSNSAINQPFIPTFRTVTTDDNYDPLQYELKICTDSNMSTNCQTFDQTSSNVGWSGQDVGTSAYSSGTTATYILQVGDSLAPNSIYYWKTRAKDYAGSGTWSSTQTTPYSFTTMYPNLTQASFRWSDDDVSGETRTTWYDTNYDYRTPVTVTNSSGSTLTDFQVSISIGTSQLIASGKMQSDCDDIRITDVNGNLLPHWIEENNPGCNQPANTKIWIKASSLPISDSTVYLYYGNSTASNNENGDNVFDFFDNFNSGSLDTNTWTATGGYSLSNGEITITTGAVYSTNPILSDSQNYIYEYRNKWSSTTASSAGLHIGETSYVNVGNSGSHKLVLYMTGESSIDLYSNAADGTAAYYNISSGGWEYKPTADTYYTDGFSVDSTNIRYYNNYSQKHSYTGTWSAAPYLWLGYYTGSNASTTNIRDITIDWLKVRKYSATPPTSSLGTETTEPPYSGATWLAAENVGITGIAINDNIRLRFSISNTGSASVASSYRLQIAPKGASSNCTDVTSGNFADVTTTIGSNLAVMTTSPNFTNQEATTNQLTDSSTTFVAGKMIEYDSNQSDSITLSTNEFTEVEYNFQLTNNVGVTTPYCFRVVNVGTTLNTYTNVAQVTTAYFENNVAPSAPYLPFVNNTTAQSGQQSPVYGLIDHTPAFSAVFDDPDTSDTASYYQLQIGSDSDWTSAEIWDSTKTAISGTCNENSRCSDIVYSGGTSLIDGSTYYWRIMFWDNSDIGGSWSDTQQFSMNNSPSVSDITINGNNDINLSENSSIGISWIATITDTDGYTNLNTAIGKLYRSGIGQSCSPDNNNCYQDTSCDFINCTGNTCDALCSANLYFFTEATDTGSTFVDEFYQAWVEASDIRSEVGSTISVSTTVDVNTLSAFSIGQSLVYGEVFAGSDTGSSNTQVTVTNTGNSLINLEITGDYMCPDYPLCGGLNIEPHYQEYSLNTFTYGTGSTLSLSPNVINIGISKPIQSPSNSYKNLYWGIGIPSLKPPGNYQGSVTILVD